MGCTTFRGNAFHCVNDHLAFMPRSVASRYFDLVDRYSYCDEDPSLKPYWKSFGRFQNARWYVVEFSWAEAVPWVRANVSYVLFRDAHNLTMHCDRAGVAYEYLPSLFDADECQKCVANVIGYSASPPPHYSCGVTNGSSSMSSIVRSKTKPELHASNHGLTQGTKAGYAFEKYSASRDGGRHA